MRLFAAAVTIWAATRWLGLVLGLARVRHFVGDARGEVVRAAVTRGAANIILTLAAFYAWVIALGLRPRTTTVGTVGGLLVVCLVAGALAAFMQPKERTPETLDVFRLLPWSWFADARGRVASNDG